MKLTSATAPGVIETYSTFEDTAEGVVDARVLGGIHWRTSGLRGRRVGQQIGAFAVREFLRSTGEDSENKRDDGVAQRDTSDMA
jgi:hypothetical protein